MASNVRPRVICALLDEVEKIKAENAELKKQQLLADFCPTCVEDIRADWLSALLGTDLVSFTSDYLGAGVLSDAARLTVTYKDAAAAHGLPSRYVLKICKATESGRSAAKEIDAYRMELDFYELFASKKDFPMRVAKCYGLYRHRDRPDEAFGLLLEDLSDSHLPLQQVIGITTEEALTVAVETGKLHAKFWHSGSGGALLSRPELQGRIASGKWSNAESGEYRHRFHLWLNDFPGCWAEYDALLTDAGIGITTIDCCEVGGPGKGEHGLARVCALMQREDVAGRMLHRWWKLLDSRPRTLVHGDLRADNLFKHPDDGSFAIIDWQSYHAGPGGVDFEQMLGVNGAPEATHAATREILAAYHATLCENGPPGCGEEYTLEMVQVDYTISCWFFWFALSGVMRGILRSSPPDAHIWKLYRTGLNTCGHMFAKSDMIKWWFDDAEAEGIAVDDYE